MPIQDFHERGRKANASSGRIPVHSTSGVYNEHLSRSADCIVDYTRRIKLRPPKTDLDLDHSKSCSSWSMPAQCFEVDDPSQCNPQANPAQYRPFGVSTKLHNKLIIC